MDLTGIGSLFEMGSKIIDRVWPDPAQRDAAKLELFKAQQAGEFKELDQVFALAQGQVDVNKVEAASASVFVSGWRPFIGWICGASLAYVGLVEPVARFAATVFCHYLGPFPTIDTNLTLQVLLGMLGLGGLRTLEKVQRVAAK